MDPTVWEKAQRKNLAKMMRRAYEIPFYRERFDRAGVKPADIRSAEDLNKLPALTKAEFRAWMAEQTPEKLGGCMKNHTSGSTGTPLTTYLWPQDRAEESANLLRCAMMQKKGYRFLTDRIVTVLTSDPTGQRTSTVPPRFNINPLDELSVQAEAFCRLRPAFVYGQSTSIYLLAAFAERQKIVLPKPKCVGLIGEGVSDAAFACLKRVFGKDAVFDIYGCVEVGNFAVTKGEDCNTHYIWQDTHCVQLSPNSVTANGSQMHGRVMLTSLIHYGFPVINYAVGDEADAELLPDGRMVLTKIYGKANDQILNRDGSSFEYIRITNLFKTIPQISQFRVIQKTYEELEVILAVPDTTKPERESIEAFVREKAALLLKNDNPENSKTLTFRFCDQIEPDQNGKVRCLICKINENN